MSKIKVPIKNRRSGKETICGGPDLLVVFPYGLSPSASTIEGELEKVRLAQKLGVDMVKDNSVGHKDWFNLMKSVSREIDLPLGASATLAAANIAVEKGKNPEQTTKDLFYQGFERLSQICDAIEVFPSITKGTLGKLEKSERVMKMVISRAGGIIVNLIERGEENPFYSDFDWFLDQAKAKDITLIFGNGLRAACVADSFDEVQDEEIEIIKEFTQRAIAKKVNVIAGIFGHINPARVDEMKRIRRELPIPLGGLGPLSTDIALGYDHINAAISIAMFRDYLDWVSVITPAEHIGMPNLKDAAEGVAVFNLVRHILKLRRNEGEDWDIRMARARMKRSWCVGMPEISLNPHNSVLERAPKEKLNNGCTLCGSWCPFVTGKKTSLNYQAFSEANLSKKGPLKSKSRQLRQSPQ